MTIEFYFDYLSPYAYLAWTQIHERAGTHGHEIVPVPVLFAALLNHHGTLGPAEIPSKRVYVFKDCMRTAMRLGVPLVPPPCHPFNPLLALRLSSLDLESSVRKSLIDDLFFATWGNGTGVSDENIVRSIASKHGIRSPIEQANTVESKSRLRDQSERAVGLGIFGVPTIVVDGEIFWGLDSLDNLDAHLRGQQLPDGLLEIWRHVRPSAERRR